MDVLNVDIGSKKKTFVVIGDVESLEVCSKWFRIKCLYCGEYFQLCLLKKNLESNLQNHVNELKYSKAVDDHCIKGAGNAFLIGHPIDLVSLAILPTEANRVFMLGSLLHQRMVNFFYLL